MIDLMHHFIIPAAYGVLPHQMNTPAATAMLLAIAGQESEFMWRKQRGGPARGFFQFERAGVLGVLTHRKSGPYAAGALSALRYPPDPDVGVHALLEHNDVLAAVFARLLLWTVPGALPGPDEAEKAYAQYLEGWRPGRPRRHTWDGWYHRAWHRVEADARASS